MAAGDEPGTPTARDLAILEVLQERDGQLSKVELKDGGSCQVRNIAWGYDAGDSWAHVTTNISPDVAGEDVDFFLTSEVRAVRAPESAAVLITPEPQ